MIIPVKFTETTQRLSARLGTNQNLSARFGTDAKLEARFGADKKLGVGFGEVQKVIEYVGGKPYEGDYVITPKVEAQTLPTKEKVLIEDMTVKSIPFFNVSNTSGGSTVYIAKEI